MRFYSAVFVVILAALACGIAQQPKAPLLEIDGATSNAGKVMQGETIRQVFTFTNKGPGTLEILKVTHG